MRHLSIIGIFIAAVLLLVACGPSQKAYDGLLKDKDVTYQALKAYAAVRQAATGDEAKEARQALEYIVASPEAILVKPAELDQIMADKYFADTKVQLKILRDTATGPQIADKARAELYRTLKFSGHGLGDLHLTARAVDALVAQANHRNEIRNSPETAAANHKVKPPAKKAPAKKRPARRPVGITGP